MRFLFLMLFFATSVSAQPLAVTNTFLNDTVADATDINQNFADIVNGVNAKLKTDNASPWNTAVGVGALESTTGSRNTASGFRALYNNDTGNNNTAVGESALWANDSGYGNTASGGSALFYNTEGNRNTASGYQALYLNTTGYRNTASGYQALFYNSTGFNNTANGNMALYYNETGTNNIAIGFQALFYNDEGSYNTASGFSALYNNEVGVENTATGHKALYNNKGGYNSASGAGALYNNVGGDFNTGVGYRALYDFDGDYNTAIGAYADVSGNGLTNATAIGYGATADASNKVRIGNTDVTAIEGQVAFTVSSDRRLKSDIEPVVDGLAIVNDLNPVSYHRTNNPESDIEMGLLAQEVEATLQKHGLGNSGMVHQPTEDSYMSLRYNDLLAPMIKAIQELDEKNQSLEAQLKSQQEEFLAVVQSQQERIAQLQGMMGEQFAAR